MTKETLRKATELCKSIENRRHAIKVFESVSCYVDSGAEGVYSELMKRMRASLGALEAALESELAAL